MAGNLGIRKKVRDNFIALLKNKTNAGGNVFSQRVEPMFDEEIAVINIYTKDDTPQYSRKHEHEFYRQLQGFIEVLVRKTATILIPENEAEIIAGQVENRIFPNEYLQYPPPENIQAGNEGTPGNEIVDWIQLGITSEGKTPKGLTDVSSMIVEFLCEYSFEVQTGSVEDFNTGDIQYDLNGEQATADQAHDRITLP